MNGMCLIEGKCCVLMAIVSDYILLLNHNCAPPPPPPPPQRALGANCFLTSHDYSEGSVACKQIDKDASSLVPSRAYYSPCPAWQLSVIGVQGGGG